VGRSGGDRSTGATATSIPAGLGEKLQALRSNGRFLDKRVADLEAQLTDPLTACKPG
jgi:hypothetical protein